MPTPFVGELKMFAGTFAPQGYALCDGQLLSVSQNDALFSLFGTIYGGDGRTTFGLPDLRGRTPLHHGSGPGLTPRNQGQKSGRETVNLSTAELPSHTHTAHGDNDTADSNSPTNKVLANSGTAIYVPGGNAVMKASISPVGGSQPHANMQPFQTINYIVALFGIYPSRT